MDQECGHDTKTYEELNNLRSCFCDCMKKAETEIDDLSQTLTFTKNEHIQL